MKVLELFSGIGGMHYALLAAGIESEVVAVEINNVANSVYRHNFSSSVLMQKNISTLNVEEINRFCPEMLLMSPPCQPFTRVGLKKDLEDVRTDPLKHILSFLPNLPSLKYILVENVKGFESSDARNKLLTCIQNLHFNHQEFLITPSQIGFPNMRTRYYLLAKKQPLKFIFKATEIAEELPREFEDVLISLENKFPSIHTVGDILETDDVENNVFREHLLPDTVLEKRAWVMDIVTKHSTRTCCFTKAYGRYVEGTGSVYCPYDQESIDKVFTDNARTAMDTSALRALHLRYFTPREVARLMSFPDRGFTFPAEITRKQKYQLLGNSVNVKVITQLITLMFCAPHR